MGFRNSFAFTHPRKGVVINLLLLAALGLLAYGVQAPILTLQKFYFFSNTVSLLSALQTMLQQREWALALLIGGFSLVFPVLKILMLLLIWNLQASDSKRHRRNLRWLAEYSRWSMLDVFVVALMVVSVKLGAVAQAQLGYGIYAFAASVVLTMLVSTWIGRHTGSLD